MNTPTHHNRPQQTQGEIEANKTDTVIDVGYYSPTEVATNIKPNDDVVTYVANAIEQVIEGAHIPEKLSAVQNTASSIVQGVLTQVEEAHVGEKLESAKTSVMETVDSVAHAIQEAHISEKIESVTGTVIHAVQEAHITDTLSQIGSTAASTINSLIGGITESQEEPPKDEQATKSHGEDLV
ncbi:hypothetical protein AKO1_007160 [Acrasis kona]|uniref:Uncharacterized protein n=1 Tax=Acrasis kona TaxID=1008807 RepID=A0AAW2YVH8_9EUKA